MWGFIVLVLLEVHVAGSPVPEQREGLERQAGTLRAELRAQGEQPNAVTLLHLAATLQQLNHLSPDGGR
jgi:hypothetical protein